MTHTAARAAGAYPIDGDEIAALIASRVCHDLSSPITAVMSGLDYMNGADQGARDQALKLISDGAALAYARLQFFRTVFGASGGRGEAAQAAELEELLGAYLAGGRVSLDWQPGEETVPRRCVQLLLSIALVAQEALPRGGVLRIAVIGGPRLQLVAMGEGPSVRFEEKTQRLLADGGWDPSDGPLLSKEAPALWAHRLARGLRAELSFGEEPGRVLVAASV